MQGATTPIDIAIVAGRRPDLLARTLESFKRGLLCGFVVSDVVANIDPIFGPPQDEADCRSIILGYFPSARITTPAVPSLCRAVATTWRATTAAIVLHLEDDWLLGEPVTPRVLDIFENPRIAQITFNSSLKKWRDLQRDGFDRAVRKRRLWGIPLPLKRTVPRFVTSPGFLRGDFARRAAALMNPAYDPEKQFFHGVNPALERFVAPYLNFVYGAPGHFVLQDIGRDWRGRNGVVKTVRGAISTWTSQPG